MSISQNFPNIDPTLRLNFQGARTLDPLVGITKVFGRFAGRFTTTF